MLAAVATQRGTIEHARQRWAQADAGAGGVQGQGHDDDPGSPLSTGGSPLPRGGHDRRPLRRVQEQQQLLTNSPTRYFDPSYNASYAPPSQPAAARQPPPSGAHHLHHGGPDRAGQAAPSWESTGYSYGSYGDLGGSSIPTGRTLLSGSYGDPGGGSIPTGRTLLSDADEALLAEVEASAAEAAAA
eukprot:COSAG01_NODE_7743_length_3076_cov_2.001344_3_plen_186_part_00